MERPAGFAHLCSRSQISDAIAYYFATSAIVVLGVCFGQSFLPLDSRKETSGTGVVLAFLNWDGRHYLQIAERGYTHLPDATSEVAFFPAYPLLSRLIGVASGLPMEWSLLILAHLALVSIFLLTPTYLNCRGGTHSGSPPAHYVQLAFGLLPSTFFFRMAYTEALFLLLIVISLIGLHRKWPGWAIALIIGTATATRSVGISLVLPFAWYLAKSSGSWWRVGIRMAALLPLSCWGIILFMVYQHSEFGDALAFVKTQEFYRSRPSVELAEKIVALATLRPIWELYLPSP